MIDDKIAYIDQMIAGNYIKYVRLNELINQSYYSSNATELNLFIDLNSVIKPLFVSGYKYYRSKNPYDIVSSVLNMCGHYKEFFTNKGVDTKIFIVMGLNCPNINSEMVPGYNQLLLNSYILKKDIYAFVLNNLSMLDLLCEHIPGIYFIDGGNCEVSSIICHIIKTYALEDNSNRTSIVLSKDILPLQLIPMFGLRVLRPFKTKDGDESYIVDNTNLFQMYCTLYRKTKVPNLNLGPNLISNLLAMGRVPERNMNSVFGISQIINIMKTALEYKFISIDMMYTQSSMNTVLSALGVKCNTTELEMRWKAINPDFQCSFIVPNEAPYLKQLRLVDMESYDELRLVIDNFNSKYTPIDLDRL